jgi:hypothetical protein
MSSQNEAVTMPFDFLQHANKARNVKELNYRYKFSQKAALVVDKAGFPGVVKLKAAMFSVSVMR